jgi:hypothetical protein
LVGTPFNSVLAWLFTLHFEVVTIMIGMDLTHAGRLVGLRALRMVGVPVEGLEEAFR